MKKTNTQPANFRVFSKGTEKDIVSEVDCGMQSKKSTILLIEDNEIALKILEVLVRTIGLSFISATSGEDALKLAQKNDFGFIISDIGLPGISGIEFTKQFRSWEQVQHKKTPTPIIGLTAHAEGNVHQQCIDAGMNEVFVKPMLLPNLKIILSKIGILPKI